MSIEVPGENADQRALRLWITAGLAITEVAALYGDAGYLLNNMIAKYTLAADSYRISTGALREFRRQGVDLTQSYSRRTFYGLRKGKNPFIYEHAVPAGVVRVALLDGGTDEALVASLLVSAGEVAVLLRSEDALLRAAGLAQKMPAGWQVGDEPTARYDKVGIELSAVRLKVHGAICR
jgi:hypothetical protein